LIIGVGINRSVEVQSAEMEIRGDKMTNEQLIEAMNEAIGEFSAKLRPLVEEGRRRLNSGQDESLKRTFRYATHLLAAIENERPN
jgi:hypothetical protein